MAFLAPKSIAVFYISRTSRTQQRRKLVMKVTEIPGTLVLKEVRGQ